MITTSIFNVLAVIAVALLVYSVADYKNKMYANVAMAFVAGFIFLYLGIVAGAGIIYDPTGSTTSSDSSLSVLFQFFATVSWVYALLMATMSYMNWKREKEKRTAMAREG